MGVVCVPLFRAWTIRGIWPDVQIYMLNHIGAVCAEQLRVERNFSFFFYPGLFFLHQFNVPSSAHTICWPVNKTPHHLIEPRRSLGSLSTSINMTTNNAPGQAHSVAAGPSRLRQVFLGLRQGSTTAAQPTFHCPCRPWRKAPEADMERLGLITPNEAHFMRPEFQEPAAPHRTP